MNISTLAGNNAYSMANKLASGTDSASLTSGASSASGGGFSDALSNIASNAIESVKAGEQATINSVTGKASLADVVSAVNSADVALKSVVAIRDKVISAYNDILKMPI